MKLRWPAVEQHIRRLVESGSYLTDAEQARLAEMRVAFADTGLPVPAARAAYPSFSASSPENA
ncbi:MAG: hypothetical protein IKE08_10235, partial [Clostridia bacterium]|nr:hypothetical protein [Clostridia bacterium]